nr:S1 family peptidase [Micromonospora sp. DSM 115978]
MDRIARRVAATIAVATLVGAAALAAPAGAAPVAAPPGSPDPRTVTAGSVSSGSVGTASAGMLAAMRRDLGLTADAALARLAREDAAGRTERKLRASLGADFGGAWLAPDDQRLMVAVTDNAAAEQVRAAGAQPTLVARSAGQLDAARSRLDQGSAPAGVAGWYVDVTTNTVVVLAEAKATKAAAAFVAASGADPAAVRVQVSTERPQTLYDVRGGEAYYPGGTRCSVGFSVNGGFVTAGHCGTVGTATAGVNGVAQGTVAGSTFPHVDHGWVAVNGNWTPTPLVTRYYTTEVVVVAGAQEAPVGAAVCRSGSTTHWRCGVIQATGATVNYPQGTVFGLTRTSACAEGGDSGGSWLAGQQAQGVTSGGSGNCTVGGTTYFQPLLPILAAYGRTLITSTTPPFGVFRTSTTQSGHRNPSTAIANGTVTNRANILASGGNCIGFNSTYRSVWSAPDSSWYIFDVTTIAFCTN